VRTGPAAGAGRPHRTDSPTGWPWLSRSFGGQGLTAGTAPVPTEPDVDDNDNDSERGEHPRLDTHPDAARAGGALFPIPGTEHSVVGAGVDAKAPEGKGGDLP
jgi:hypothetical protein